MNKSEQLTELGKALALAQGELESAKKDSANPFFKSRYADLETCWDAIRPTLKKHGLSVIQTNQVCDDGVILDTMLLHASGQWIEGSLKMKPTKNDPQGIGSCITYARRYALASIVGLTQTDDDGNHASGKEEPKVKPQNHTRQASVERQEENPPVQPEDSVPEVNQEIEGKRQELLQELQGKMKEAGLKPIDIMNVARVFKKDEGKTKVSELSLEKIELFVNKWEKIVAEHEKIKKQA